MRRLHAEVRRDVARRELAEHVKLGPGGIREIEFIVQALQLVRGGRDPELHRAADARGPGASCREKPAPAKPQRRARRGLRLPAQRRAPAAVPRRRAAPRPAGGRRGPRARGADVRLRVLGGFLRSAGSPPRGGDAPLRGRVRRAATQRRRSPGPSIRASPRCARASATRALPEDSRAPPRRADPGARARRARDRRPGRDARARRRPGRGDRAAAPPTSRCSPSNPRRSSASRA